MQDVLTTVIEGAFILYTLNVMFWLVRGLIHPSTENVLRGTQKEQEGGSTGKDESKSDDLLTPAHEPVMYHTQFIDYHDADYWLGFVAQYEEPLEIQDDNTTIDCTMLQMLVPITRYDVPLTTNEFGTAHRRGVRRQYSKKS